MPQEELRKVFGRQLFDQGRRIFFTIPALVTSVGIVFNIFVLMGMPHISAAATIIEPNTIFPPGETVWIAVGSPYVIESGYAYFPDDVSLVLEAGTVVKLGQYARFYINGDVDVQGTAQQPVHFTSLSNDSIGGDTDGDAVPYSLHNNYADINLYGSNATFEHASVTMLRSMYFDKEAVTISHSTFDTYYGVSIDEGSALIENSIFTGENAECLSVRYATVAVSDTRFDSCYTGVATIGGTSLSVSDSTFTDNVTGVYISRISIIGASPGSSWWSSLLSRVTSLFVETALARIPTNLYFRGNSFSGSLYSAVENEGWDDVDMVLNWWGDASGPYYYLNSAGTGDAIYGSYVLFRPWLTTDPFGVVEPPPPEPVGNSSVIFIPGVKGSRLYEHDPNCWFLNCENELWVANRNADAEKLYMDESGHSIRPGIYTDAPIDEAYTFNVYKGFMSFLDDMVASGTISQWKAFPYDWRKRISEMVDEPVALADGLTYSMFDEVVKVASSSQNKKVTIVAHSTGGLVAKYLVSKLEEQGLSALVERIIFVATPHLGTPEAAVALLHGDGQGLPLPILLNETMAREMARNMPGVYHLLPSPTYFDTVLDPIIEFSSTTDSLTNFRSAYGDEVTSWTELSQFLSGADGRLPAAFSDRLAPQVGNQLLLSYASSTHESLDTWVPPVGVNIENIVGWGLTTVTGIRYTRSLVCVFDPQTGEPCAHQEWRLDHEPITKIEGDGVVVYPSASIYPSTYFDLIRNNEANPNVDHAKILEATSTLEFIGQIVVGASSSVPYFVSTKPVADSTQVIRVAVHSPVSIGAHDSLGRYTGLLPVSTSTDIVRIFEEIPNSTYLSFGEGKYIYVLEMGEPYTYNFVGEGFGTFTVDVVRSLGDVETGRIIFTDIATGPTTKAELVVASGSGTTTLHVDVDGNGTNDFVVNPSSDFDPILYMRMFKKMVPTLQLSTKIEKRVLKQADRIIMTLEKGKDKKVELRVRGLVSMLSKFSTKKHPKISEENSEKLAQYLEKLLDK